MSAELQLSSPTIDRPPLGLPARTGPTRARFDHLRALEAESIHIMREVVAEFERPVMLYSIGKDSSVMLRLAQKAFHPGPIPFPLLHVDTTYKFREMIEFRDWYAAEIGARLIVHTNEEAIADGTQPFAGRHAALLRPAEDQVAARRARGGQLRRRVRRRPARRGALARQGADLLAARREGPVGSEEPAAGAVAPAERPHRARARASACSRSRTGPRSTSGSTSTSKSIPVVPLYFAKEREVVVRGELADRRSSSRSSRCCRASSRERVMCRMRSLGCSPCTGAVRSDADTVPKIIEELIAVATFRAPASRHRPRSGRVDGAEEARRLLLMSGPAPHLHGRQRGRWEEHADRPAAVRLALGLRGSSAARSEAASKNRSAGPIDFSLFTDGLRAEREQGITIDVAYRYFATARRKFILADTPGHEQYTRNMATGASTADLAILLVDARHGVRGAVAAARADRAAARHHRLRAGRQQDGPRRLRPRRLRRHLRRVREILPKGAKLHPIPISALHGDNVITRSERTPWFDGTEPARISRDCRGRSRSHGQAVPHFRCSSCSGRPTTSAATPDRLPPAPSARATSITVWPSGLQHARRSESCTWDGDLDVARRADVGHAALERRDRHQPRRHAGGRRRRRRAALRGRHRVDGRTAARPGSRVPAQARRRAS